MDQLARRRAYLIGEKAKSASKGQLPLKLAKPNRFHRLVYPPEILDSAQGLSRIRTKLAILQFLRWLCELLVEFKIGRSWFGFVHCHYTTNRVRSIRYCVYNKVHFTKRGP